MSWTSAEDIRKQIERRWKSGEILRALLHESSTFPMSLRLSVPSSREMAMDLARAQEWFDMLRSLASIRVEWREVRSHTLGQQQLPVSMWVDTAAQAINHLQVGPDVERFLQLHAETKDVLPELVPWVERNPLRTLSLEAVWKPLLQVAAWKKSYPSLEPMYVRQVDLPGIDTKFIERNAAVLSELFDVVAPRNRGAGSTADFRTRHGFLREPVRIRFRVLDPLISFENLPACPDVELDEDSFAALRMPVRRVFATENKTNFLAFPDVKDSIIFQWWLRDAGFRPGKLDSEFIPLLLGRHRHARICDPLTNARGLSAYEVVPHGRSDLDATFDIVDYGTLWNTAPNR